MSDPCSLRWRLWRSAVFAAIAAQLAALGHYAGGGGRPDPAVLLIGAATIGLAVVGLTTKRRSAAGILGVMLLSQLAFHLLFSVDVHAIHGGHTLIPADPRSMIAFHLVAAVLSSLVLARGERALFGLFAALRRVARLTARRLPAHRELWTAAFAGLGAGRPAGPLLRTSPRRGPPSTR